MKKVELHSIYDKKSERFDTPVPALNTIMAKRRFIMAVRNPESAYHHFPEDFSLVLMGIMDLESGEYEAKLDFIMDGKDVPKEED